jgi:phosphoribosyl-ATP pyrophosphohydrolase
MNHLEKLTLVKMALHPNMASAVSQEIVQGRNYPLSYTTGEMKELAEALVNRDKAGIKEEWQDVLYALQLLAHQRTGLDFRLRGVDDALGKFRDRFDTWERLFDSRGVEFDKDYLTGGSNYRKPEKIRNACRLAGHELSDDDLREMESLTGDTYEIPVGE